MGNREEHAFEAHTYTSRARYVAGVYLLPLAALLYAAWLQYPSFLRDVHSPDRGTSVRCLGHARSSRSCCLALIVAGLVHLFSVIGTSPRGARHGHRRRG